MGYSRKNYTFHEIYQNDQHREIIGIRSTAISTIAEIDTNLGAVSMEGEIGPHAKVYLDFLMKYAKWIEKNRNVSTLMIKDFKLLYPKECKMIGTMTFQEGGNLLEPFKDHPPMVNMFSSRYQTRGRIG